MGKLRYKEVNNLFKDIQWSNDRKNSDPSLHDHSITLPFKSDLNMNERRK